MSTTCALIAIASLVLGGLLTWLFREREMALLRTAAAERTARAAELAVHLSRSEANLAESRALATAADRRAAALQERVASDRESFDRQRAGIEEKMAGQFAGLAQRTLDGVSRTFLDLAAVRLGEERQTFAGIIMPVREEFTKFSAAVSSMEKNTSQNLGNLRGSIDQVIRLQSTLHEAVRSTNDATGQLRNALQNPRVAGNWGEISLDRIVELAGMTEHCDFDRQTGVRSTEGTSERPDLLIRLTDGMRIPVDAKASTANYIRAASECDDGERNRLLKQSAFDLKSRVAELRTRSYDRIEGYAGMTFLFVPNESMLSSALSLEPDLVEESLRFGIIICSPLLLLCYLRAFANGWRIQQQQENAREVARRGRMLHDRLQAFFVAVGKVGRHLNHTVENFNVVVGKMDNLLVPGRELGKLLAKSDELKPVDSIDTAVRTVRFSGDADASATALPEAFV